MAPRQGVWLGVSTIAAVACVALAVGGQSATAATPAVVGEEAPVRTFALTRDADGSLTGTVSVPLRNDSGRSVRLAVWFFPDDGTRPSRVGITTSPLALAVTPPKVKPRATTVLTVAATLTPREAPSDLDGALAIEARARGKLLGTTELRLTGALALPRDVAFEPSKVTLQVTKFWPLDKTSGDETMVRLRGPGVARLVDSVGKLSAAASSAPASDEEDADAELASAEAAQASTLLLTNTKGDQTLVELSDLRQTAVDLAEVTVSTHAVCPKGATPCEQAAPKPGAYTGALSLTPGASGGPQLDVTVQSQEWLLVPVALLLLGSLIGGLLPQLTQTAEMKDRLRSELRPLLDKYEQEASQPEARALLWDLETVLGGQPWYEKRYRGLPGDPGVAALWADIHRARNIDELTPDVERVREYCAHVRRWLDVLPLATELVELHRNPPADRDDDHPWESTCVRRSTERLLRSLANRLPPKNDEEADALTADLRRQTELHTAFARAWIRFPALDRVKASNEERRRDKVWWDKADIDAFDERLPKLAENDPDMSLRLTEMAEVSEAIERLLNCYDRDITPEEVDVTMSRERRCAVLAQVQTGQRALDEIAQKTGVTVEDVADIRAAGVYEVEGSRFSEGGNGQASHLGTDPEADSKGPASASADDEPHAGDGDDSAETDADQPMGAPATAVATVTPAPTPAPTPATGEPKPNGLPALGPTSRGRRFHLGSSARRARDVATRARDVTARAFAATDWIVTIAIALATAVVYMVPFYTGTWGSWEDWLTAFAAGLAGQVAIKWALLPALRSRQLPRAQQQA